MLKERNKQKQKKERKVMYKYLKRQISGNKISSLEKTKATQKMINCQTTRIGSGNCPNQASLL